MSSAAAGKRTREGRFLPYHFERHGLGFELTSCALDGQEEGALIDPERRRLSVEAEEFRTASVRFTLDLPAELLQRVVSRSERTRPGVALLLCVRCPQTRLRSAVWVAQAAPVGPSNGRVVLHRDQWHGPLELTPFLVRKAAAIAPEPGYASAAGARLASARPWTLHAEPEPSASGKFLDVRYSAFGQDELLSPYRDSLYRLESDQEQPVLWINSDHEKVATVLDDRGTRGSKARMRDVFFDQIAYGVWAQLVLRAASRLRDGSEASGDGEAVYAWEGAVLREVLPEMYPTARTHSARLAALGAALAEGDLGILMEQLDRALQRKNEARAHMVKLAEEVLERRAT